MLVKVFVERSKSRSGIHACRRLYVVVDANCRSLEVQPRGAKSVKTLYSRGEAFEYDIVVPEGYFVVQASFVRGLRSRVKGELIVLDPRGNVLCKALYRKLKIRLASYGSDADKCLKIVRCIAASLKIPVKRYAVISR